MTLRGHLLVQFWALIIALACPFAAAAEPLAVSPPFRIQNPALEAADIAFKQAYRAQLRDDLIAFEAAARQVPPDHLLAGYLTYWRLRLQLRATDRPIASLDRAVRHFIDIDPQSIPADLLRRQWMLELAAREQWQDMLHHLPAWLRRNDTRVMCRAGQARLALGQEPGADAMQALHDDRDLGEDCGAFATALVAAGRLDHNRLRARMWLALERRDWASVRLLAEMLGSAPEAIDPAVSKPLPVLQQQQARGSAALARAPAQQRDALLIALVSHSRLHPEDAASWMGTLGDRLTDTEQRFVWSQIAASAMRDMIAPAFGFAQRALGSVADDVTRRWLARAALRQQDWPMLKTLIAEMAPATRRESTWMYWLARAQSATDEPAAARALLQKLAQRDDFYGTLAAEEFGRLVQVPPTSHQQPDALLLARVARLPGLLRAQRFYALGMLYQGNREWSLQLRERNDAELRAIARHACQLGLAERCVATAWQTRHVHDWSLRFLTPHRESIESTARKRALDPAWVFGLMQQESRFRLEARSGVGARGLMQIMPATGRWIARQQGIKGFHHTQLDEFATNLDFGTFYLQRVYGELDHSMVLASAAYNAGPRRPRRWQATLPGLVDGPLFVEIIPFSQTRNYVKKVLLNTAYYGATLEGRPQSLKRLLGNVPDRPFETVSTP